MPLRLSRLARSMSGTGELSRAWRGFVMNIRIETLSNRVLSSTFTEFMSDPGAWVAETVAREFECSEDDVGEIETDDGDLITVCGEPVARVVKTASRVRQQMRDDA